MSAVVTFELARVVPLTPAEAWRRLTDWRGHGDWVPATWVDVDPTDPNRFIAWSGVRPLVLEDRMHADVIDFDPAAGTGRCHVHKLGPVLVGEAEFSVAPALGEGASIVTWRESVTVPYLPRFLAPVAAWAGAALFGSSLRRMARV